MKTQDLLELEPGTELAVVGHNHSDLFGGVPPEARRVKFCRVKENGRYTRVVVSTGTTHQYEHEVMPREVFGTYEAFQEARREADGRMRAQAAEAQRREAARQDRFEAVQRRAMERGVEVAQARYYGPEKVMMTVEALEALLGE